MLDEIDLDVAIDDVIDKTRRSIMPTLKPEQDIHPVMFRVNDAGEVDDVVSLLPLMSVADTMEKRRRVHAAVSKALHHTKTPGYIVLFMGWSLTFPKDKEWDGTRPSESPDRIEVLVVAAGSATVSVSRIYQAKRDETGKLVDLIRQHEGMSGADGLFMDMLREAKH